MKKFLVILSNGDEKIIQAAKFTSAHGDLYFYNLAGAYVAMFACGSFVQVEEI